MADSSKSNRPGDLGSFIKAQRGLAELSQRELAKIANVSDAYVSQLERGLHEPTLRVLRSIAAALDIRAETMLRYAGWLEDAVSNGEDGRADVVMAIKADDRLTNPQKQALLSVYNNFIEGGDT
ncbi:MAG: helix-turn-helix domain-containing protein [Acidimicrobiales bacterium]